MTNQIPVRQNAQKKEALPGLIGGQLDALPWRWCPLSGTRPAPFAGRRSVAALGVVPLPLGELGGLHFYPAALGAA